MAERVASIGDVVRAGLCTGCGACVAADESGVGRMEDTVRGPEPRWPAETRFPEWMLRACPGAGVHYPDLYRSHYGRLPENWLTGHIVRVRTGHAADPAIRAAGASGGVLTRVLQHLLETKRVHAVVAVRQGVPSPERARAVLCRTARDVLECAQSVYVPVSVLDVLRTFQAGERYAMVCLPDQSAALRVLQREGFPPAQQVDYVVGPYTGTALYPAAIAALLRSHGVRGGDSITRLRWRAGDWPGHLEVRLASGRVVRSPKVYYNFLIPFFVTRSSLLGMDFANEFADLAVGDAWSPAFERAGGGHSVFTTRTERMEAVVAEMIASGLLAAREEQAAQAADMHGHMLDFKKRGGYLRGRGRTMTGRPAPDHGYRPARVPFSRVLVEVVISGLFAAGGTRPARWLAARLPERVLGPLFNRLRLAWKAVSRPTKRRGLADYRVVVTGARS